MVMSKGLALVTGGSTGIGRRLAQCAAEDGYDLIILSDDDIIADQAELTATGVAIETICIDLSNGTEVEALLDRVSGRTPDLLFANAGRGLSHTFIEQEPNDVRRLLGTNVVEMTMLIHRIAGRMVRRGSGRILITGSIAGNVPGPGHAVYNASKAYVNLLASGLRDELADTGVTVTCLMPGLTDTEFFRRAGLTDTGLGKSPKDDPERVARGGYAAMMAGRPQVIPKLKNKAMVAMAHVSPKALFSKLHKLMARPRGGA